jgi:hypothetical protein
MKYAVKRNPGSGNWIMYRRNRFSGVYNIIGWSSTWQSAIKGL